jgi:predicted nucleic acid-binding protein
MILLETSVLSEAIKPEPNASVRAWLDAQRAETVFISNISIAELLFGLGMLPDGPGKDTLSKALDHIMQIFSDRTLTFERLAAWSYAELSVKATRQGKSFATADLYNASIASALGLAVASRHATIFEALGLAAINPWTTKSRPS